MSNDDALNALYHAICADSVDVNKHREVDVNVYLSIYGLGHAREPIYFATPLHFALHRGCSTATIKALCDLGARADMPLLEDKDDTFHRIASHGVWPAYTHNNPLWSHSVGTTPLHMMVQFSPHLSAFLQVPGIDVETVDSYNVTPLQALLLARRTAWMCQSVDFQRALTTLLHCGANPNRTEPIVRGKWCTALNICIQENNKAALEIVAPFSTDSVLNEALQISAFQGIRESLLPVLKREVARRERKRLQELCLGLAALDLPVLCQLEIVERENIFDAAVLDTCTVSLATRWNMAASIKRAASESANE